MGNRKTINPDGVERYRVSSSLLDSIFRATLGLDPNLKLSPIKLKELFTIAMCMIAEYFFENPQDYVDYGFLRVYKPDGKGKFLIWEVTEENLFWHPEEATKRVLGEGNLIEEFKKQLMEFIQSVTKTCMTEEVPIKEIISKLSHRKANLEYNRSEARLAQERIRDKKRYAKERERRVEYERQKRRKLKELKMNKKMLEEKENKDGN